LGVLLDLVRFEVGFHARAMQQAGIVDYRKGAREGRPQASALSAGWGKVHPTVALDSTARAGKDRRSPLSACRRKPVMPKTSSSIERRSLLLAVAALALARRAAALPGGQAPSGTATAPSAEVALAPQLAAVYVGQVDPARCFVSEKYDGVRALWDGRVLRHRSGRVVSAPPSFIAALPAAPLDGELWLGRGRFDALSARVRRAEPDEREWREVRYMVFDTPVSGLPFAARLERLAELAPALRAPVEIAPQWRGADRVELERALMRTVAAGGEGLMLHVADAPYTPGRSEALMKLKPHLDAEAVVVGHRPGSGKYRRLVGALEVESAEGRRFFVGSGLSDRSRREPPAIGTTITYRYRALTSSGLPRFATYLRPYDDG
jgi:DNA ligase-1